MSEKPNGTVLGRCTSALIADKGPNSSAKIEFRSFIIGIQNTVPIPSRSLEYGVDIKPRLVSVRVLAGRYGVSLASIYGLIRSDPTFPYRNVGLRKKFVVDLIQFETWMTERVARERQQNITVLDGATLLHKFRK